jgi:hypothetical protein
MEESDKEAYRNQVKSYNFDRLLCELITIQHHWHDNEDSETKRRIAVECLHDMVKDD